MKRRVNRGQRSQPGVVPPPLGGLNGRDGLSNMPREDAYFMENWFPGNTALLTRKGCSEQAYLGSNQYPMESFLPFAGTNSSFLMFINGKAYWLPNSYFEGGTYSPPHNLALFVEVKAGLTSGKVTGTMFATGAGAQYLIGVNGANAPFSFDGSTYTDLSVTGLSGGISQNGFTNVFAFKGRLYWTHPSLLGFHYTAVNAIQGAASYFDLGQQAVRGGRLQGVASFSHDSGDGMEDFIVFITTKGEYLVYQGTDPSSAANFALVGRYYGSAPFGRKGWFNFRSDLFFITNEGVISIKDIMANGADSATSLTSKLGTFLSDYNQYKETWGWMGVQYPKSNMLLINVPKGSTPSAGYVQFVMNTDTGAWTKFTGWDGLCFDVMENRLFFSTNSGTLQMADQGYDDDGVDIVCDVAQAYDYFEDGSGAGPRDKHFHFATYVLEASDDIAISACVSTNFVDDTPVAAGTTVGTGEPENITQGVGKLGYCASTRMKVTLDGTETAPVEWFATRHTYEKARGLVI